MLRNAASRANSLSDDLKQTANFLQNVNNMEKYEVINSLLNTMKNLDRVSDMLFTIIEKVQGKS